jgi:hypothetical protein
VGDENLLLDNARRYFTQAGQSDDIKKMRMLVELGLDLLRLAQSGQAARTRAGTAAETTDQTAAPAPGEDDAGSTQT